MQVLITGASKGIGRATALHLQHRYALILHARSEDNLYPLLQELQQPDRHTVVCADFSDQAALTAFCALLRKKFADTLMCVINNAGITLDKSLLFQPESDIDKLLQVNLKAPIMVSKSAFKVFHHKRRGTIVNISSCVGEMGNAFQCVYAATKAGLSGFTKSLAREAGALLPVHQIRAFCVSPGYIETEMTSKIPEAGKANYIENIPAKRFGRPEEVAALIAFLLSEEAPYINGSEIKINGGIA